MKPPILSDKALNEVLQEVQGHYYDADTSLNADHIAVATAQRDADVAWFKESKCGHCDTPLLREGELYEKLQQAKAEVAREIFEELGKLYPVFNRSDQWLSLKSKYTGGKK